MTIKDFLFKIFRRLKLGRLIYYILYLFNISICRKVRLPSVMKARQIIKDKAQTKFINSYHSVSNYKKNKKVFDLQIIVPVYNSENYIQSCLNSILNQKTNYNFQIIIVNDGSTDNTACILNKYNNNSLVKVIDQKNYGRSYARNVGLDYANSCNYIMFVDSDDKLPLDAVQLLLNNAYKLHADISFGGYTTFNHRGYDAVKEYMDNNHVHLKSSDDINGYLWGKVFKSSLFEHIRFPIGYEFEDTILAFWIYPKCKRISSINKNVYYYRNNPKSISHTFKTSNISIDSYLITELLIKRLSYYNIQVNQYLYNTFLAQVKMNCKRNVYMDKDVQKSIFVLTCNLYYRYFNKFKTNLKRFKPLEKSLIFNNYNNYILCCLIL